MSETNGNGKGKWVAFGPLVVGAAALIFGSGWVAAIKTDAAHTQKVDTFMESNAGVKDDVADLKTAAAVGSSERAELREGQRRMQEAIAKMADKIDLLVQSQMKEGRIAR